MRAHGSNLKNQLEEDRMVEEEGFVQEVVSSEKLSKCRPRFLFELTDFWTPQFNIFKSGLTKPSLPAIILFAV